MHAQRGLLLVILATQRGRVRGQDAAPAHAADELQLPTCAAHCLDGILPACAPGSTTDHWPCVCASAAELLGEAQACVAATCTTREALTSRNVTEARCGTAAPPNPVFKVPFVVVLSLVVVAVALRLFARKLTLLEFWWDDLCIVLALVFCSSYVVLSLTSVEIGAGKDVWQLPFDFITQNLQIYWINSMLYSITRGLTRTSLVFFYLRIFPAASDRRMHRLVVWTGVLNAAQYSAFAVAVVFQCRPVPYFWHQWDAQAAVQGRCAGVGVLFWAGSAVGVVFDLWEIVLPWPGIWKLKLGTRAKVQAGVMLSFGLVVFIMSMVRLTKINHLANSTNPTRDYVDIGMNSGLELLLGVFCTCLPGIRVLLVRYAPRWLGFQATQVDGGSTDRLQGSRHYATSHAEQQLARTAAKSRTVGSGSRSPSEDRFGRADATGGPRSGGIDEDDGVDGLRHGVDDVPLRDWGQQQVPSSRSSWDTKQ